MVKLDEVGIESAIPTYSPQLTAIAFAAKRFWNYSLVRTWKFGLPLSNSKLVDESYDFTGRKAQSIVFNWNCDYRYWFYSENNLPRLYQQPWYRRFWTCRFVAKLPVCDRILTTVANQTNQVSSIGHDCCNLRVCPI